MYASLLSIVAVLLLLFCGSLALILLCVSRAPVQRFPGQYGPGDNLYEDEGFMDYDTDPERE